jgi:TnpA family transposase
MELNRPEYQELAMLSLHLLQTCLVYINTLMMLQVLFRLRLKTWELFFSASANRSGRLVFC